MQCITSSSRRVTSCLTSANTPLYLQMDHSHPLPPASRDYHGGVPPFSPSFPFSASSVLSMKFQYCFSRHSRGFFFSIYPRSIHSLRHVPCVFWRLPFLKEGTLFPLRHSRASLFVNPSIYSAFLHRFRSLMLIFTFFSYSQPIDPFFPPVYQRRVYPLFWLTYCHTVFFPVPVK